MDNTNTETIRLIYPQWQGANISGLIPELDQNDASKGYILGSHLLNFLAPKTENKIYEVPISEDITNRKAENGILDYRMILKQSKDALKILENANPDKIVTLGGECSVSVVPFTYLAKKYKNDIAVIWIDAHPDINIPFKNRYQGYHAMALTAAFGMVDDKLNEVLPTTIEPSRVLTVGVRDYEGNEQRASEFGISNVTPEQTSKNTDQILNWLKSISAKHVLIHFDMDVLDPREIIAAVGVVQNGMKIEEVVRVINDISKEYEIIGLTIAEPMPRTAIKLKNMLNLLPLI